MVRALTTLGLLAALGACAANNGDEGMIILNNTAPPMGTTCMLTNDMAQAFISHGIVTTSSPVGYLFTPLFVSRVTALMGQELQRTIQVQGANIDVAVQNVTIVHADNSFETLDPTAAAAILPANFQHYRTLTSGSLTPGGSANISFQLIPPEALITIAKAAPAATDRIHAEVLTTVTAYGTMGGSRVDGLPFQYPVTICNDCVIVDNGACPVKISNLRTGDACNMFQDGVVDCCESGGGLVCPATTM